MGRPRSLSSSAKSLMELHVSANPQLSKVMSEKEIMQGTLADMILAQAGSMMIDVGSSGLSIASLDAQIRSNLSASTKIPPAIIKQGEEVQSKFKLNETMRTSLEAQYRDLPQKHKKEMQDIMNERLENKIDDKTATTKLSKLHIEAKDLAAKINAYSKTTSGLKNDQVKALEEIYKQTPEKYAELKKKLKEEGPEIPQLG